MNAPPRIFDPRLVRLRRQIGAARFGGFDFLHRRAMEDIADRLETIRRDFPLALFTGAGGLETMLTPACRVGAVLSMDAAPARLGGGRPAIVAEEEALPLAAGTLDLVVSLLTLHRANDLIGALAQIRAALKPDGLFIAAVFGEETLRRLRNALYTAEAETTGGASARIAPFATIQDFGQALARAGFALPVTDIDKVEATYENPMNLIRDLRGMGETGGLASRPAPLRRSTVLRAMEIFKGAGGKERFDIVYLTGWAPHDSQPRPLKPGSANASLEEAVKKSG